jgi:hypothetical protein
MRDLKVEQYLDRGRYAYEYIENVPIVRIDKKKSKSNPSRAAIRLDEDRAIQYGLAMESGSDFPAIVLLKLDNLSQTEPDLLVISGMHRLAGFDLSGITKTDAYIINEPDEYRPAAVRGEEPGLAPGLTLLASSSPGHAPDNQTERAQIGSL